MNIEEFMTERYKNREDVDNMFGVGISDAEFRYFIIDYLLGENWYVVDPLGQTQINEIAIFEILEKYSKRYKAEIRNKDRKRGMKMNGWLSKDGDFIPCEHMQHANTAKEKFGLTEQGMYREGLIKVFTAFGYTDVSTTRFLTDAQKTWLEEHEITI